MKRPGTLCRLLASLNSMDGKDGLTSLRLPGLMAGAVCKGSMLGIAVAEENEHLDGHLESIASWFLQMVMAEFGPELQAELAVVQERTASQAEDYTVHTMAASPSQQDGNQLSAALDAKVGKFLEGCLQRTFPLERYFVNMDHWPATILGIRLLCRSDEEEGEVEVPRSRTRVQVFGQRKDGKDFPTASGPVGALLLKVLKREASLLFAKHYGGDRGVAYSKDTEPLGSKCSMVIFHDFEPLLFVFLVPVQCISHQSVLALYVRAQEGDNEMIMSDLLQEQLNAISKRTDSFSSIRSDRADSNYSVMHRKPIPPEIHFIEQEYRESLKPKEDRRSRRLTARASRSARRRASSSGGSGSETGAPRGRRGSSGMSSDMGSPTIYEGDKDNKEADRARGSPQPSPGGAAEAPEEGAPPPGASAPAAAAAAAAEGGGGEGEEGAGPAASGPPALGEDGALPESAAAEPPVEAGGKGPAAAAEGGSDS